MKPLAALTFSLLLVAFLSCIGSAVAGTTTPPPKDWTFWVNEGEGFGATFPGPPERVDISTAESDAHAYMHIKREREGVGATYSIVVEMLSIKLSSAQQIRYLEFKNSDFIKQMSVGSDQSSHWESFGKGQKRLFYKFKFKQENTALTAYGFWIIDGPRVFKVGVAYTEGLSDQKITTALTFPNTFFFISNHK